jgi:hypothetical protein
VGGWTRPHVAAVERGQCSTTWLSRSAPRS